MGKSLLLWSNLMSAQDLRVLILSQESILGKHPHAFIHDPDAAQCMKVSTVLCIPLYLAKNLPRSSDTFLTLPSLTCQAFASYTRFSSPV